MMGTTIESDWENTRLKERIEKLEYDLLNLVCRIHRDGGHYIAAHGEAKAIADADLVVAENNVKLDTLQADNTRLRSLLNRFEPHDGVLWIGPDAVEVDEVLASTPAQSLAAIRE